MARPLYFTRKRPSWGTRRSEISSSLITLIREITVEWCSLTDRRHGLREHSVNAELDDHRIVASLNVNIGSAPLQRRKNRGIDLSE